MRCAVVLTVVLASFATFANAGCNEAQPSPRTPQKEDGVPANSLSDARLHGEEEKPKDGASAAETKADPTQPYTTKVGEAPPAEPGSTASGSKAGSGATSNKKPAGESAKEPPSGGSKGAVVSRSECDRVMDRYIELEVAANPQLKGLPPDVIEQAKQMARDKHGEAPCTATRAQYTCAMAASSTAAWQRCMK